VTGKKQRRGPRKGVEVFTVEGHQSRFRKPFFDHGAWRVRRRDLVTEAVTTKTLESLNYSDAKDEVIKLADKERREAEDRGKPGTIAPEVKGIRFGDAVERWKAQVTAEVREVTAKDYRGYLDQFKAALRAERLLESITLKDLEDLFTGRWKDLTARTKMKYRAALVRMWDYFRKHRMVPANIAIELEIATTWKREVKIAKRTSGQALSVDQARALVRAAREPFLVNYTPTEFRGEDNEKTEREPVPWIYWVILIGLKSGLRISNILPLSGKPGLLWSHVDLAEKVFRIPGSLLKNAEDLILPINAELAAELTRLRARIRTTNIGNRMVVPGFDSTAVRKVFDACLRRAGLGDIRPRIRIHDLKHSYAAWIGATCPRAIEQRLLGHTPETISDHYARHQTMDDLRKGIDSLPALLVSSGASSSAPSRCGRSGTRRTG